MSLAFLNAIKINACHDFEIHIARLFRCIEGSIKTTGNRSASAIPETENPVIENVSAQTAKRSFARRITIFLITSAVVLTAAVGSYIYSRYPNISTLDLSSRRDTPAPLARPSEVEELLAGN